MSIWKQYNGSLEYVDPPTDGPWIDTLICCICLDVSLLPVRPPHPQHPFSDCAVVMPDIPYRVYTGRRPPCLSCYRTWARQNHGRLVCPRCRAPLPGER